MLAELSFDELKNGYEVRTAEQEGRLPPPGFAWSKGAVNCSGFGGMSGRVRQGMVSMNIIKNMNNMGRGWMGMDGMNRGMGINMGWAMGKMSRMGNMGNMGNMGMGGMGGMGNWVIDGMGMGNMSVMSTACAAKSGRQGTGMGNMPQGYSFGNKQRRWTDKIKVVCDDLTNCLKSRFTLKTDAQISSQAMFVNDAGNR